MPEFWINDGTPRKARELYFNDGTLRKIKEAWFNDGTAVRKVYTSSPIVDPFNPWTLYDRGNGNATAQIRLYANGAVDGYLLNNNPAYSTFGSPRWREAGTPEVARYYVKATLVSGTAPVSGIMNQWWDLWWPQATDADFLVWSQEVGNRTTRAGTIRFDISTDTSASPNIVLTTNVSLTADGTG